MANQFFARSMFGFLQELIQNNNRDWFDANRDRYEALVRTPALNFITHMADELPLLSPYFTAIPKKVGGSLMRVHRDTRFSKNKQPYKTNVGIQFRHEAGKDVHAPGYYIHAEPGTCFIGAGIWRPDAASLTKIRDAIDQKPEAWTSAKQILMHSKRWQLSGESLINAPRGYDKAHPLLEDLKRKDFIAVINVSDKNMLSTNYPSWVVDQFSEATPYMRFLCQALELRF